MKHLKYAIFALIVLLVASMTQVSLAQLKPLSSTPSQPALQPSVIRRIEQPLCFYQKPDGTLVDLSQFCGSQIHPVIRYNTPRNTPYNPAVIQQYDREVYGADN